MKGDRSLWQTQFNRYGRKVQGFDNYPTTLWLIVGLLAFVLMLPPAGHAELVPIANPSFEQDVPDETWTCFPEAPDSCYQYVVSEWAISGSAGTWRTGTFEGAFPDGLPDGVNTSFVSSGTNLTQTLSTLLAEGYTYTLQAHVGRRSDTAAVQYAVRLYAGGHLLAQDASTVSPEAGQFVQSTVTYTAQPGDTNLGFPVTIQLVNAGSTQVSFDMVSLDVSLTSTSLSLTPIEDQTVQALDSLTVPITATDTGGNPIVLSALGLPDFAAFTDNGDGTGSIIFNPPADVAPYYDIKVIAEAGGNTVAEIFRLNIEGTDGSIVFAEGFEVLTGGWEISNGVWEIGAPTSGPLRAHEGVNCLATILSGNYSDNRTSRVMSSAFTVAAAADNPRLRFLALVEFQYG